MPYFYDIVATDRGPDGLGFPYRSGVAGICQTKAELTATLCTTIRERRIRADTQIELVTEEILPDGSTHPCDPPHAFRQYVKERTTWAATI